MSDEQTIQRIIALETAYYDAFCTREEAGSLTRFEDMQIRDMYSHNFTQVRDKLDRAAIADVIRQELEQRRAQDEDFLMIRFPWRLEGDDLPEAYRELATVMEYYRIARPVADGLPERDDVEVIALSDFLLEDARDLDELCEEGDSAEFTNRRFDRRSRVYLSDAGPDQYLALLDWLPVGSCDYFAAQGACMLEDFIVDPVYRHQGIGTTILKSLARHAFQDGNDLVFLTADRRESAREMYRKLGFELIWECTELLIRGIRS